MRWNLKTLAAIGVLLFFAYRLIINPLILTIICIIKLTAVKKDAVKMGRQIVQIPHKNKTGLKIALIVFVGVIAVVGIVIKHYIFLGASLLWAAITAEVFLSDTYGTYNGIYENGIIFNNIFLWKDIFSWKLIEHNYFSFLKQDGLRFDLPPLTEIETIKNLLINSGIKEE